MRIYFIKKSHSKDELVSVCSFCKRYLVDNKWIHLPERPSWAKNVSHGYCPDCAKKHFYDELDD